MKNKSLDDILNQWANLGAGFDIIYANDDIDLERLIIDTSRYISKMSRLYIMTATWLHIYGDMVAKHRLKRLINEELELEYQPVLGLLLDTAQEGTHPLQFKSITDQLSPARKFNPLFDSFKGNSKLAKIAKHRASDVSCKWKLWAQPIDFKDDAIRPSSWIINRYPILRTKAEYLGDLRASILSALKYDEGAGYSEGRLAECAGGSRAQVHSILRKLELTCRVETFKIEGANRRVIQLIEMELVSTMA